MKVRFKPVDPERRDEVSRFARFFLLAAFLLLSWTARGEELQTAEQIRQLTSEQASNHYPVHLKGVVTFYDGNIFSRIFQDQTAGIYLQYDTTMDEPPLASGQLIEVFGETDPGEFAPVVMAHRIKILGLATNFPAATPVSFEQIASGQKDSQFVEMHGIVRETHYDPQSGYYLVVIATGGGQMTAYAKTLPVSRSEDLVDSTVTVRGVVITEFNRQRQLFDIRLLVPRTTDVVVDKAAPADPFAVPAQPVERLLQFTPQGPYGHRVKVVGTVIYRQDDNALYIEDATEGLYVETTQPGFLLPGDEVEVLGFPAKGEYTPMLQDAIFRKVGSGKVPVPDQIITDGALKGTHDCRLVTIEGVILDRARHSEEQFLVLQAPSGFIFHAYLEKESGIDFKYLQNGTKVAVTGVCLIETGSSWQAGGTWRAKSFRILLRSASDIFVLKEPPWWNLQRLLWIMGILVMVVLLALAWVVILRRRVHKQTQIIREKLQVEAALKERYENLFENANDIVFTCDFHGRLTSVNKTGEELLQYPRDTIVGKNLVDLMAEEQRTAATQWFKRVLEETNPPTVEWDFVSGSGQRLRLEIGTRVVRQNDETGEVEGIARDITERKRLEKEILETSNREKQRIGHDLHDGVCQQLAGIAYRVDILVDQLQEKKVSEASEAERIGSLINDAITQTRGVARGLFPVRLEESGLILALEDLVANTCNLFKVKCDLDCDEPGPVLDNSMAAHLYYIAQEAVLNAEKHGKATHIAVSLKRIKGHFELSVRDNGTGFKPVNGNSTGMGIRIMHYRAKMIGATLDLKSTSNEGTEVVCAFYPAKSGKKAGERLS